MAEKINETDSTALGCVHEVKNLKRKKFSNEDKTYFACHLKDVLGDKVCVHFSDSELKKLKPVLIDSSLKIEKGVVYPFRFENSDGRSFYFAKLEINKVEKIYKASLTLFKNAHKRALKNPEDITDEEISSWEKFKNFLGF